MGLKIRRVPPNWEHPTYLGGFRYGQFMPIYDQSFSEASQEWKEGLAQWEAKTHLDYQEGREFWEWYGNPPDREHYLPDDLPEKTWYQVYSTVSEGTPRTPPFPTLEELYNHLIAAGIFRDNTPWDEASAQEFVFKTQWLPSGVLTNTSLPSS
jgi:hypothetical protein